MSYVRDMGYDIYQDFGVDPDDDNEEYASCEICGCDLDYVDCPECGGEGERDLYDENPNEYEPGEVEKCSRCNGEGGYAECPNAENHHDYMTSQEPRE